MHRKRGDSLEQSLVMPSPLSSRTDFRQQQQHQTKNYLTSTPRVSFPTDGCISRMPFSSLAAFLFCLFGVVLFTTMMIWSFNASVEHFRRATYITDIPWLDKVQLLFIVSALAMIVVSLAFLLIGLLSTGSTREKIFKQVQARRGGRVSAVVAICLATALNILWMLILTLTGIFCFIYITFSVLCSTIKPTNGHSCLNFGVFKTLLPSNNDASLEFCDGQLQQFCAVTNTVVIWYLVGSLGSLLISIGLVLFIATNAANYAHIGNEERYNELKEVFYAEMDGGGGTGYYQLGQLGTDKITPRSRRLQDKHFIDDIHKPSYTREYQQQQRQSSLQQFRENNNIGAVMGSHRRYSYQNSLNGSNNWLSEMEPRRMY